MSPEHPTYSMSFGDHLEDLRRRLVLGLVGIIPIFIAAIIVGPHILDLLILPVQTELHRAGLPPQLQATGPVETFATYFRIAIIVTILVGSPWLLYQTWLFVAPGLYEAERRFVYFLVPMSAILTTAGTVFLYFVMLPVVLSFFIGFGAGIAAEPIPTAPLPEGIVLPEIPLLEADPPDPSPGQYWFNTGRSELRLATADGQDVSVLGAALTRTSGILQQYRISEYVKLFLSLALAFAVGFQTPLVVLLLAWAGIVDRPFLLRYRRHAIMVCAIAAALLTPADPLSMILLAVPLYLLYELGLALILLLPPERIARGFKREPPDAGDA